MLYDDVTPSLIKDISGAPNVSLPQTLVKCKRCSSLFSGNETIIESRNCNSEIKSLNWHDMV